VIVKKLQNGADLMIPGIVLPKGVDGFGMKTFGEFKRGQPCSVATADNGAVAAVGTMAVDNLDFYMSAGRGKGEWCMPWSLDYGCRDGSFFAILCYISLFNCAAHF
jgi:hypothetical protein